MNSVLKRVQKINLSRFMMMHNKRTEWKKKKRIESDDSILTLLV